MPRLDELANVALRVPSILLLDLLYKCDMDGLTEHLKARNEDMLFKYKYVIWNMYYLGKCASREARHLHPGSAASLHELDLSCSTWLHCTLADFVFPSSCVTVMQLGFFRLI